eukprot:scaffold19159_cov79-Skeletonema_marinoi.AAC.1
MDALHTPEVRKLLDQFAISMCRLVDVMSSGKAKQIWFDVSDTIWAALEVGSDDVMVMALAEGCAKVCFALERERESLKRRKRGGGGDGSGDEVVGKRSGKIKTERLIAASRRRKERDQRQMETYPPGKEVLRGEGGRADIEDALMDGLGSFTRDDDQQREDDNVADDADQIYMNMSSIVDNNDRPPQRVIVHTTSMEDHPQPFPDPNSVLDRDDESEITTEIEDLRRNEGVVEHSNDLRPQSSASMQMTDNRHQQEGALAYEDERGNPLDNDALSKHDDVEDEQDGVSEQYDNFDEPVLQFYRRLNDVLTQTRKEVNLREALEKKQNDASSKRAGYANVQNDDRSIEPINQENGADQSASHALFSISKKWWKILFVVMICGTLTMCLLWAALGCYGFYMLFIAETHAPMTAAQVQPIVIQIASTSNQGLNNACTLETDQSDRHDVASISLDDWKELKQDVDAAIDLIKKSTRESFKATVLFGHALSQLQVGGVPAKTLHAPTTQHFAQDRNNHGAKVDEDREDDDEDREDDHEEMEEESEGGSEDDYSEDEEETHYFIDTLRTIVDATPLSQLLLSPRGEEHETVSSLQVQSLVSVINADLSGRTLKHEPKHVVVETCSHIITAMQGINQQIMQDKALYADPMGMDAVNRALSTRIKRLPADRMHNIDGCVTILDPPDTFDQVQPSTIVKEVEDILKSTKAMKDIFQLHIFDGDEIPFQNKTVDELRTNS